MGILENPGFFFITLFTAYVAADSGDDFSNNLFSDLAPLLALFGERVTMQFMSQATGWADNIILAMAPLGIITIIVAAIRVGGPAWLKAVIGRARENRAIVEAELMSSTSKEVCELWNGQEVVRCMGKAPIVEFICLQSSDDENKDPNVKIVSFAEATKGEHPVLKTPKSKICGKVYNWFGHLSYFSNDGEERGRVERNERGDKTSASLLERVAAIIQKTAVDAPSLWRRIRLKFSHTSYPSDTRAEEGEISPNELAAVNNPTPDLAGGKSQSRKQSRKEDGAKADHRTNNFLITRNDQIDAPNISLNSHDQLSRRELYLVAAIGVALQLGVLVFSGFVTYSLKFPKGDVPVTEYAYPCTVVGTLVLVLGVMICAHVVETSTDEKHYQPVNGKEVRVIWLQQTKTVNDQDFQSFAIFPKTKREFLTTSKRKKEADDTTASVPTTPTPKNDRDTGSSVPAGSGTLITLCSFIVKFIDLLKRNQDTLLVFEAGLGTFVTLCGFIVQFVGLRSMHWSASIAQLVAILIMMGLKALVRRGLAKPPNYCRLPEGFELDWFALTLGYTGCAPWLDPKQEHEDEYHRPWANEGDWALATAGDSGKYGPLRHESEKEDSRAHRIMMIRRNIGMLADWRSPTSTDSIYLARAIEIIMNALFSDPQYTKENLVWERKTRSTESVNFRLHYQKNNGWKAYADELDAALSLWLYFNEKEEKEGGQGQKGEKIEGDDTWLRVKGSPAKPSLRLLGSSSPGLLKDLDWWLPVGAAGRIKLRPAKVTNVPEASHERKIKIEPHRIVGSCQISDFESGFDRTWERHDDKGEDSRSVLAVENYTLLKQLYAQDMLSAFMWAAATKLETPVPGNADIHHPAGNNDTNSWQSFKLQNDCLSKMTQDIMNTGLGSREDIYLSIIPPLSISNKLPQIDSIIQLAREHAKPYEQLEQWKDASNTYLWLFREVQRFPKESDIVIKAIAILVEHLRRITLAVESKGIETGHHGLKDLKSEIETELRTYSATNNSRLISNIMKLYDEQMRWWHCGLDLKATSAWNDEDRAALKFTRSHQVAISLPGVELAILISRNLDKEKSEWQHNLPEWHRNPSELQRNPSPKDIHDWTPLHYAAAHGSELAADALIDYRADANARDLLGWTPLHYACMKGEKKIAEILRRGGAKINAQGRDGIAPLQCAATNGHLELLKWLISAGATTDILDASGMTPLLAAAMAGKEDVVEELWPLTNQKLLDSQGRSAVHFAALGGHGPTAKLLLNKLGADKNAIDSLGREPLHCAGELDVTKILIAEGAHIEARDQRGQTPLHWAAANGHKDVISILIDEGANKEAQDGEGQTPLHFAAANGHKNVICILIDQGADIKAQDQIGLTPLHCAAEYGHKDVISILIDEGANKEAQDKWGQTPLHMAAYARNKAIIRLLIDKGANKEAQDQRGQTPLHCAAAYGHKDVISILIDEGSNKEAQNKYSQTPLHTAADGGNKATIRLLIDEGANKEAQDKWGQTPLHMAAKNGNEATIRLLIDKGANKEAQDNDGQTPLHMAAYTGNKAIIRLLIDKGANKEAQDQRGQTPLHCAAAYGHKDVISILIDEGANKEAQDNYGQTPLRVGMRLYKAAD